jgi:hypothetical protein
MATQIQLQSTNYNGQLADITFYPCSGGSISLGYQTIPYTYTNDDYEGTYDLFFSAFSQTCQLVITCPTPTPTVTTTNTPTPTNTSTPTTTPTPTATLVPAFDADAAAYLNAIILTGGTLSPTISAATNTLFTQLKGVGLYSKIFAFYPQLGASSGSNSINAKLNTTYDLTWNGGFTWSSTGSTGNGTNGWANPNIPITTWITDPLSWHILAYQNTSNTPTGGDEHLLGSITTNGLLQLCNNNLGLGGNYFYRAGDATAGIFTSSGQTGSFMINKAGTTTADYWRNTDKVYSINGGTSPFDSTSPLAFWALYYSGSIYIGSYANQTFSFICLGSGLSDGEAANLQTIINTFQTSLGRNTY